MLLRAPYKAGKLSQASKEASGQHRDLLFLAVVHSVAAADDQRSPNDGHKPEADRCNFPTILFPFTLAGGCAWALRERSLGAKFD